MEQKISAGQLEEMFEDLLDESGQVVIAGYNFNPSQVLKTCDAVAYRSEMANYADSLSRDGYEVEGY